MSKFVTLAISVDVVYLYFLSERNNSRSDLLQALRDFRTANQNISIFRLARFSSVMSIRAQITVSGHHTRYNGPTQYLSMFSHCYILVSSKRHDAD